MLFISARQRYIKIQLNIPKNKPEFYKYLKSAGGF